VVVRVLPAMGADVIGKGATTYESLVINPTRRAPKVF
jgi:hypothetical protein